MEGIEDELPSLKNLRKNVEDIKIITTIIDEKINNKRNNLEKNLNNYIFETENYNKNFSDNGYFCPTPRKGGGKFSNT